MVGWYRAFGSLWWLSLRRLLWSTNTIMVLVPLVAGALFLLRRRFGDIPDPERAFRLFSEFLLVVYASFFVPICAIAYGSTCVGAEREDRTLVYLLIRPFPRPLILLAKFLASWPLTVGLAVGTFWVYCQLAGDCGHRAFAAYATTIALMATTYVSLFHFLSVWFRHATILALVYVLFLEVLVGNMPGIVKRAAINYYGRVLMYAAGEPHGLAMPNPNGFEMLASQTAGAALWGLAAGLLLAAIIVFQYREYRDLT